MQSLKFQNKFLLSVLIFFLLSFGLITLFTKKDISKNITGAPPYGETLKDVPRLSDLDIRDIWERPVGPAKVGLQVGHWKNEDLPEELERIRTSHGASGGGKMEWEVNLAIAEITKEILEEEGIKVDILPATVPKDYWADVFVAIHADGSDSYLTNGFKVAAPWRDFTGNAEKLSTIIEESYKQETNLQVDPNITRNMRGYYAFSWWRFDHSIHPMTTAVILETGFLTNWSDQQLLINTPEIPAQGLANGIIEYLESEDLL